MDKHKRFYLGIKGLIKNKESKILLLLKAPGGTKNLGMDSSLEYWDFPGGRIRWGDTIEETLKRELKEEIGLERFENKGLFYATISNIDSRVEEGGLALFIYKCIPTEDFEVKLSKEDIKFGWFDKGRAVELLSVNYPEDFIDKLVGS